MGTLFAVAAGFPTLPFTAAVVVGVVFWILVAAGLADSGSFDADVNVDAWGMGGVPVTVTLSAMAVLAWCVSLTATVLLDPIVAPGMGRAVERFGVPVAALLVAGSGTRLLVRLWRRHFPDEPGPSGADTTGLERTGATGQSDAAPGQPRPRPRTAPPR